MISQRQLTRRRAIVEGGVFLGTATSLLLPATGMAEAPVAIPERPFRYALNSATIRGQKLSVVEEAEIAAKAGYDGFEPWVSSVARYAEQGHSLKELRRRIADLGLVVESAIGFPSWIVDDDARRAEGIEQMKRDMDLVRQIGGCRIAAPPAGAHAAPVSSLARIAVRYRTVLELGRQMEVVPQLELWGSSPTLSRLGEVLYVAAEAGHPDACLLLDAYHLYKGGSDFTGLKLINWSAMHLFHINDYPAHPPRESISDRHRVYPGDGVCPLPSILRDMYAAGFRGGLSLEVFNPDYWREDPLLVARTGLEKIRVVVQKALGQTQRVEEHAG